MSKKKLLNEGMSAPPQILKQLKAHAAGILAEGIVLTSFAHRGIRGIAREHPIRRFLRDHLPGRFHVGQGSIASSKVMMGRQNDIIVADRDLCFMLLNTLDSQLFAIESVHLICEVRSRHSELHKVARSLRDVRNLNSGDGLRHEDSGSRVGATAKPVHTVVIFEGPKEEGTLIRSLQSANEEGSNEGDRMAIDFVLVLSKHGDNRPDSGYLVGYSRFDAATDVMYPHHYYPKKGEEGVEGPRIVAQGEDSFARWYAGILNHLSGVKVYPPNVLSYLGNSVSYVPWTDCPQ